MALPIEAESSPRLALFVDHENVALESVSLDDIMRTWISAIEPALGCHRSVSMLVRAYGGWYCGETATDARFRAFEYYQNHCPSIFERANRYYRVSFEFADGLLNAEASQRITHTVAARESPQYFSRQQEFACSEDNCQLSFVKTWMRKRRACPRAACPHPFSSCFFRLEQKQVDVHLATDILLYALAPWRNSHLAVATDDVDIIPAIAAASGLPSRISGSLAWCRWGARASYLDAVLLRRGVKILPV